MGTYEDLKFAKRIWIWGMGELITHWIWNVDPCLPIVGICDSDLSKMGKSLEIRENRRLICYSPEEIKFGDGVIIAIDNENSVKEIERTLEKNQIACCHLFDAVQRYYSLLEEKINFDNEREKSNKVVKFIDCLVPIGKCNLRCSYCYLNEVEKFKDRMVIWPSAKVVRKSLSRERLGGTAFINLCGDGETMLYDGLTALICELIKEGHYVQVVTNVTITSAVEQLIESQVDFTHLFIKCSLQYLELKHKNMLGIFSSNVKKLEEKGCSISIEVTPHDELIPYINELKDFSMKEFGALPHITTARNEQTENFELLTELSREEYQCIWGQFDSPMFDFKIMNIGVPRMNQDCMAGKWSLKLDLATGELLQCPFHKTIDFIYSNIEQSINLEKVGKKCLLPYCYNCHAYLTWGTIEEVESPTYLEMRDRMTIEGKHWIGKEMRKVMSQKLFDNN